MHKNSRLTKEELLINHHQLFQKVKTVLIKQKLQVPKKVQLAKEVDSLVAHQKVQDVVVLADNN